MTAVRPSATGAPGLARSRDDRLVAGVAGGLAEHEGLDPGFVRAMFVLLATVGGAGFVAYILLWVLLPNAQDEVEDGTTDARVDADHPLLADQH